MEDPEHVITRKRELIGMYFSIKALRLAYKVKNANANKPKNNGNIKIEIKYIRVYQPNKKFTDISSKQRNLLIY